MPIYEYACKACKHSFDALQKMSDAVLVECPECGEPELKKLLSAPNFRLKGAGWYETDFKTDKRRNLADDAGKKDTAKTDSNGKDSAGKDAKSGSKSDSGTSIEKKSEAKKASSKGSSSSSASSSD